MATPYYFEVGPAYQAGQVARLDESTKIELGWATELGAGETIATSVWTVIQGALSIGTGLLAPSITGTMTVAWIAGALGHAQNTISTSLGRTLSRGVGVGRMLAVAEMADLATQTYATAQAAAAGVAAQAAAGVTATAALVAHTALHNPHATTAADVGAPTTAAMVSADEGILAAAELYTRDYAGQIPGGAGAPTGTPTEYAGRTPLYVDQTSHTLYGYFPGSGWVAL